MGLQAHDKKTVAGFVGAISWAVIPRGNGRKYVHPLWDGDRQIVSVRRS
jgi:hypothetical protein